MNDQATRRAFLGGASGAAAALCLSAPPASAAAGGRLKVDGSGRFLVRDGARRTPFFWLGDTAWRLAELPRADIARYLADRSARGFTVVQAPVVVAFDAGGVQRRDADGNAPLRDPADPTSLTPNYLATIDFILDEAARRGLYVAVIPGWSQDLSRFDAAGLRALGRLLGGRYRSRSSVVWIAGGEAAGEMLPGKVDAIARGLREGHGGSQLITVHPGGNRSSAAGRYAVDGAAGDYAFHDADWLDFNMIQSGHLRDRATWALVERDRARLPAKPTLESEYFYEDALNWPDRNRPDAYRATDHDARKGGYWSVFAGGFGYTYGHHAIWQNYEPGREASNGAPTVSWRQALGAPGAAQMIHLRRLIESRPTRERVPDQALLLDPPAEAAAHCQAMRDTPAPQGRPRWLMVYSPLPRPIALATSGVEGARLTLWAYDPRTGRATVLARGMRNTGRVDAAPPSGLLDWVLVVDDTSQSYPPPGGG